MSECTGKGAIGADLIDRATSLQPQIAAAAKQIDDACQLPGDLVEALHEARLFRMLMPTSVGGFQVGAPVFFRVIEAVARADASTAWCVGQANGCSMAAAFLAPEAARKIFGDSRAVMASGPSSRNAKAVIVEGGYRVSGRWPLASGGRHATWFGGHSPMVRPDGSTVMGPDGKPEIRTMMFPRSAVRLIPNWDVLGLRGTGSDDYEVEDVLVPAAFSFTREKLADRRDMSPLYEFTGLNMFGIAFAATALGIARAALDDFVALAGAKTFMGQARLIREGAANQLHLGLAEAKLRSARAFLVQALSDVDAASQRNGRISREERINLRLATTWAIHQSREAVDFAHNASGASALHKGSAIERRFRDIHAVTQHVQAGMPVFETMGQALLGLPVTTNLL